MAGLRLMLANATGIRNHWLCLVPALLVIAALSFPKVDLYPPRTDEFYSMYNSGWTAEGAFSVIDVLESLVAINPNNPPGYYILLNIWGSLAGTDIALGRLFSAFAGLLATCVVCRLARDLIAPIAGLFAVVIMTSNAFYNFYFSFMRMYTLLALATALVFWCYFRLGRRGARARRRDYLALFAASTLLVNTHAFSLLPFIALGVYHLLHLSKDAPWRKTALTFLAAFALFSPWVPVLLGAGIDRTYSSMPAEPTAAAALLVHWLTVMFSGSQILVALTVAGMIAIVVQQRERPPRHCLLLLYFLIALTILAQFTSLIPAGRLRLTLSGFVPLQLCLAAAMYGLYYTRKWLGVLTLLWIIAALQFHQSGSWTRFLSSTSDYPEQIPWQAVSRLVGASPWPGPVIGLRFDDFHLHWHAQLEVTQHDHFFQRQGSQVVPVANLEAFAATIEYGALSETSFWVMLRRGLVDEEEIATLAAIVDAHHYQACERHELGIDTVLTLYGWKTLACREPALVQAHDSHFISYEFYGAAIDQANDTLLIVDAWTPRRDFDKARMSLSLQLLSEDWQNVASLDLPLEFRQGLRQFIIDISQIAAGSYRLVAIVYDNQTGERSDWRANDGPVPAMQTLTEITIPGA